MNKFLSIVLLALCTITLKAQTSAGPVLYISGTLTNNEPKEMTVSPDNSSVYTFAVESVKKGDNFMLYTVENDEALDYWGGAQDIVAYTNYTLTKFAVENAVPVTFSTSYKDVEIRWNSVTNLMYFTGTETSGEPVLKVVEPTKTTPAQGATVNLTGPFNEIEISYSYAEGIGNINRQDGEYLIITRNGEVWDMIPQNDPEYIFISRNYPDRLVVRTTKLISEKGEYALTIPEKFIEIDLVGFDIIEEDHVVDTSVIYETSEFVLNFSVNNTLYYSYLPKVDEVKAKALQTVTITYPEGAVIKENPDFDYSANLPALYFSNFSKVSKLTDYNIAYNENVVTLTATDPGNITDEANQSGVKFDYVNVPQGAWLIDFQGEVKPTSSFRISGYTIEAFVTEGVEEITLHPGVNTEVTLKNFETLQVEYPHRYTFNQWSTSNPMGKRENYLLGYLRIVDEEGDHDGTNVGTYTLTTIDTANHMLTLTLEPDPKYVNAVNDEDILPEGEYTISLVPNIFNLPKGSRNTYVYFTGYKKLGSSTVELQTVEVEKDVYTITGMYLGKMSKKALHTLPRGLYIVSGKKQLVK